LEIFYLYRYLCLRSLHKYQIANTRNHAANENKRQQQCQPTSTANTGASIAYASPDATDDATDYGEHAASSRTTTNATTPVA
jgi:hypothetical protein